MNSIEILYFWHLKLEINYRRLKKIIIIIIIIVIIIIKQEERYNYCQDSVLLKLIKRSEVRRIYVDLEGYISPSIISGEDKRRDIIIVERDTVYVFELTIGFETDISTLKEKMNNFSQLLEDLKSRYKKVKL